MATGMDRTRPATPTANRHLQQHFWLGKTQSHMLEHRVCLYFHSESSLGSSQQCNDCEVCIFNHECIVIEVPYQAIPILAKRQSGAGLISVLHKSCSESHPSFVKLQVHEIELADTGHMYCDRRRPSRTNSLDTENYASTIIQITHCNNS